MKKTRIKWITLGSIAIIILVVGVPIAINECYKANSGYITIWSAADVLSYYGTIMGALVAAITIVATISFTRKQIQWENYLKTQTEKWSKIEVAFMDAASRINPYQSIIESMDHISTEPNTAIRRLQKYQVELTCAFDQIPIITSKEDYLKFRIVVIELEKIRDKLFELTEAKIKAYENLRKIEDCEIAQRILACLTDNGKVLPEDMLLKCQRAVEQAGGLESDAVYSEIDSATQAIAKVYADEFRPALFKKKEIFESIYIDIQKNANQFLHYGSR